MLRAAAGEAYSRAMRHAPDVDVYICTLILLNKFYV